MAITKTKGVLLFFIITLIVFILYFLFMYTDFFFPSPKKIQNQEQLETEIIKESLSLAIDQDTLYLASRSFLICGNDSSLNSNINLSDRFQELKDFKEYEEPKELYGSYSINNKTIIYGEILNNEFRYKDYFFMLEQDSSSIEKNTYDLSFLSIKKDTVIVNFTNSYTYFDNSGIKTTMTFVNTNNSWHRK